MAGRKKAETGLKNPITTRWTEKEKEEIEKEVGTIRDGVYRESSNDVVRDYFKLGKISRVKLPDASPRMLPRIEGVCCGSPAELSDVIDSAPEVELNDPAALAWVTPHSFIGVARGWSMHDQAHPGCIGDSDELLMVPIDEWKRDIVAGTVVLAFVQLKDGSQGCTLKEHIGKILRARNPGFRDVDFNLGKDVKECTPLAVCVWRLGRCMV